MGYNGPAPPGPKPHASPAPPPAPWGAGPLGRSRVNPSGSIRESYRTEFLGEKPEPERGFCGGLLFGLFLGS